MMKQIIQKEFRNIQSSTNTVSVNKPRPVSTGHVARMVDLRRAYTIFIHNFDYKPTKKIHHFEGKGAYGRIVSKFNGSDTMFRLQCCTVLRLTGFQNTHCTRRIPVGAAFITVSSFNLTTLVTTSSRYSAGFVGGRVSGIR